MSDNQQPSIELRTCRKCGETKQLDDFAIVYTKNTRGKNYRQHTCKICANKEHAERMRKARANNAEKYRNHQKEHRNRHLKKVRRQQKESKQRLKLLCMEAYGGPVCVCCGETCMDMLNIDHINEDGSYHRKNLNKHGNAGCSTYHWLKANDFPDGFQVLCYNCNISKHRNGICSHQLNKGSETIPKGSTPKARWKRKASL